MLPLSRRFLCASLLVAAAAAYKTEDNVVVLDPDSMDGFIKEQPYTIIEFYAPWCGHCKSLAPEWASAAGKTKLLKPPVLLAKVDADAHKSLAEKYDVSGYPTIKVFREGKVSEYEGPRDAKGIVKFVKKEVGVAGASGSLKKLSSAADAPGLKAGYALHGFFREPVSASAMFNTFSEVASELPSYTDKAVPASYSSSYGTDPVAAELGIKTAPAILLFSPGKDPASMPIPRNRKDFSEDLLVEWIQKTLA